MNKEMEQSSFSGLLHSSQKELITIKRTELAKKINEVIKPVCENAGFIRHKKELMYFKITDTVLNTIVFDTKSTGFECWICVQPLYIFNEAIVLNLGDAVWRIDNKNFKNYHLNLDMDEDEISKNLEAHILFFKKTAFSWFDRVGNPKGISDNILSNNKDSKVFFTPDKWRYEAKAYSDLCLKNYKAAQEYFEKFISELIKDGADVLNDTMVQNVKTLILQIQKEPLKANEILHQNVQKMKEFLQVEI